MEPINRIFNNQKDRTFEIFLLQYGEKYDAHSNKISTLYAFSFIKSRGQKKNFSRSNITFFQGNNSWCHQFTIVWTFLQLRNFSGGFHEDFYPLIYHSLLSIKHLIGPKVITLIDCKVHLHKIHREHMKIQRFQVDPQFLIF